MKRIHSSLLLFMAVVLVSCGDEPVNTTLRNDSATALRAKAGDVALLATTCDITGNASVCLQATASYTYTANFPFTTVTWSVQSGNIAIVGGQGTATLTVSFPASFSGGTLLASASDGGDIVCSDTQAITLPASTESITVRQTAGRCMGDIFTFTASPSGSYTWTASDGAYILNGQGSSTIQVESPLNSGFQVFASRTNACGTTSTGRRPALFDATCE